MIFSTTFDVSFRSSLLMCRAWNLCRSHGAMILCGEPLRRNRNSHGLFAIADDSINACLLAFLTIVVKSRFKVKKLIISTHPERVMISMWAIKKNKFSYSNLIKIATKPAGITENWDWNFISENCRIFPSLKALDESNLKWQNLAILSFTDFQGLQNEN